MKQIKILVIGAGGRGRCMTDPMLKMPEKFKVVGVADPEESLVENIRKKHNVDPDKCFDTWEKAFEIPKFADVAIIATMDDLHLAPAVKAMEMGYDLLLEKPAATTAEDCAEIYKVAKKYGRKVMVCHVLRFTPFYTRLKEIIDEGILGKVISIDHREDVGNIHQSHSFVRGNWGNSVRSTPMILQKCCHDMDILQWLIGKRCTKIQSFGSLTYFRRENAPEGSPERCYEGCPVYDTCLYNSVKLYYDDKDNAWFRWASTKKADPTDEQVMEALKTTQYGKCVFKCDNDVVDHQTVNMEFEDGTTVVHTMNAFNQGGRYTHIFGTKGHLYADMGDENNENFKFYNFETGKTEILEANIATKGTTIVSGHGGGDQGIVEALYDYINGTLSAEDVSEIGISCENHLMSFAAEESRLNGTIIDMNEYRKKYMYE